MWRSWCHEMRPNIIIFWVSLNDALMPWCLEDALERKPRLGSSTSPVTGHVYLGSTFSLVKVKTQHSATSREKQQLCTLSRWGHFLLRFPALGEMTALCLFSECQGWIIPHIWRVHPMPSHHLGWNLAAFTNVLSAIIESCWNTPDIPMLWSGYWMQRLSAI